MPDSMDMPISLVSRARFPGIIAALARSERVEGRKRRPFSNNDKSLLEKTLKVSQQSTFVVFKQGHEVTRSTGQTSEPAIRAVLEQAL